MSEYGVEQVVLSCTSIGLCIAIIDCDMLVKVKSQIVTCENVCVVVFYDEVLVSNQRQSPLTRKTTVAHDLNLRETGLTTLLAILNSKILSWNLFYK